MLCCFVIYKVELKALGDGLCMCVGLWIIMSIGLSMGAGVLLLKDIFVFGSRIKNYGLGICWHRNGGQCVC